MSSLLKGITASAALALVATAATAAGTDWPVSGHDAGGQRYSPLTQINKSNVANLQIAWTYHLTPAGYTGRPRIDATFAAAGLAPDVVMSALDADVIKTYVEVGLGVGIVASMAFDPARDVGLKRLDASHLFELNTTRIAVRRGHYLRGYAYRFLEDCSAALTPDVVKEALEEG